MNYQSTISDPVLPQPSTEALRHSNLLVQRIRARMQANGPMPFADFMHLALYEPELGYYMAGLHKFGAAGDFVTAPEISPLFSFCLAAQCMEVMQYLPGASILEIGAGSGVMAADILSYLADKNCLPKNYFILELSAELRQRQQTLLHARVPQHAGRVRWLSSLEDLDFQGVVLANEVLDAMPVNRFYCGADGITEMCVYTSAAAEGFVWTTQALQPRLQQALDQIQRDLGCVFSQGYVSEVNLAIHPWLAALNRVLRAGIVLIVDYGYPRTEYYHPERGMGTLSCHYRHRMHNDPLVLVGLQDITAFVDFSTVAVAAETAGYEIGGFIDQAGFLLNCGIENMCAQKLALAANTQVQLQWTQQLKTLLLPAEMGERFKVLALHKAYNRALAGFGAADQRHRL
ncbi:MAG TPA: SAM-dependent methyltransferase [Gammaproteobacteria bacterium]